MFGLGPVELILIAGVLVVFGIVIAGVAIGIVMAMRINRRPPED